MTTEPLADPPPDLEELVALALEELDARGPEAVKALLLRWPGQVAEVERVLRHAHGSGLVGNAPGGIAPAAFPERLGDFRLVRRLGAGGMGEVFEAEQESLRRRVAVKVIRADLLFVAGARERFAREVDAVARLRHPGIVPVLAVGEHAGVPFFAMELVRGCGTDAVLSSLIGQQPERLAGRAWRDAARQAGGTASDPDGPPERPWWAECVRLARDVAEALAHAHAVGVVHRDLKPSNVMLTGRGDVRVVDFGLAHIEASQRLSRSGSKQGSPAYMSPEQLRGEPVDERTDVYSLGATLYEWLTLRAPFSAETVVALEAQVAAGVVTPLARLNPAVPREVSIVVAKAMDVDRARRYASMAALRADLEAVLVKRPIAARSVGVGLRLWRWAQRHRASSAALAVAALAVLALPLVLLGVQRRANRELAREFARAERSLDISLEAVERMLVSLGDSDLVETPGSERVRQRVLQDAVELHERLQREQPARAGMTLARGRALYCLATALGDLGRSEPARAAFVQLDALPPPGDPALAPQFDLLRARALAALALLDVRDRRLPECAGHAARARQLLEALAGPEPARSRALVDVLHTEGTRAGLAGDAARRLAVWRDALAAVRALLAPPAGGAPAVEDVVRLATVGGSLASALAEAEQAEAAEQVIGETVSALDRLPEPRGVKARRLLAINLGVLSSLLAERDLTRSLEVGRRGLATCAQLHRDFPRTRLFSHLHAALRLDHAQLLRPGEPAAAVRVATEALGDLQALDRDPSARADRGTLALGPALVTTLHAWHVEDGRFAAAAEVANALAEAGLPWADPYAAAQLLVATAAAARAAGHAGLAETWLDGALAGLLALEQRGWPAGRSVAGDEFAPLRARAGFTALLGRVR